MWAETRAEVTRELPTSHCESACGQDHRPSTVRTLVFSRVDKTRVRLFFADVTAYRRRRARTSTGGHDAHGQPMDRATAGTRG